jgi:3-hydroxyisobutyrate dehydrogenase-like beta-hydroxyacid dehydrogenase
VKVIGFIGLGNIGTPMALRLADAGYQMVVHDVNPAAVQPFIAQGARGASSPAAVARESEIVFMSLPNSTIVEKVVLGPEGVLEGTRPGQIVVDLSTSHPDSTRTVAERLSKAGAHYCDAPVSGGRAGAHNGTLTIMFGGEEEHLETVAPILRHISKHVHHMGGVGTGHVTKLVNNVLASTAIVVTAEAMAMAVKGGVKASKALEVLRTGSGRNSAVDDKFNYIVKRDFDYGFHVGLAYKALGLALDVARSLDVPMTVATCVREQYGIVANEKGDSADFLEVVRQIEQRAKVEISD